MDIRITFFLKAMCVILTNTKYLKFFQFCFSIVIINFWIYRSQRDSIASRQRKINVKKKMFFPKKKTKKTNLKFLNIHKGRNYSKCKLIVYNKVIVYNILSNRYLSIPASSVISFPTRTRCFDSFSKKIRYFFLRFHTINERNEG